MISPNAETIAALATPVGTSALGIIRVSGPGSRSLAGSSMGGNWEARRIQIRDYKSLDGNILDQVSAVFYRGPASFTGEDSLEITAHGSPFILQKLLGDLLRRGCRPATPGEFTRRAFENGKLDLTQAEAVMDLIHSRGERALEMARRQLAGGLAKQINGLTDKVLRSLARVEAYIDFPDEDLPSEDRESLSQEVMDIASEVGGLLATKRYGDLLRDGIRTVILGEPNAGKSSLLNRLVGSERALVSPEPGTTRDFIEERVVIGGHTLRLIDTAGLNPSPSPLERRGMEKTVERSHEADLFLWVIDPTRPLPSLPVEVRSRMDARNTLIVVNKRDIAPSIVVQIDDFELVMYVSALTGEGISILTDALDTWAAAHGRWQDEEGVAINARHADALTRATDALTEARVKLESAAPAELLASDLRAALDSLGEIGGTVDNERMLDHLFGTFCIGK
ncbi:MAG: tRNA uridine-5-carboxymethylaminomethyl(34) synthesis GTPase MnmE [Opitutaceae bacterium]|nr:tRNA uridine-5-carboxymethylaminomethyl(34) synthesis GTPase MnmE [Opitutaceae bacterium]